MNCHASSAAAAALAILLGGCAHEPTAAELIARAAPAETVTARGETVPVATARADAADDPAIWRNPADPAASLIVGTDKKAGLYVYGLDGRVRDFHDAGLVNNVDLKDGTAIGGTSGILVAASDRNDPLQAKIALFRLDPATAKLTPLGTVAAGAGEAYGICLARLGGETYAFAVLKDGTINQIRLTFGSGAPAGETVRTMKLATQSEGCAVDERTGRLYVAEEDSGLWRFDAAANGSTAPARIAAADGRNLVADAEGVALAPVGARGGYLLVSSQGDNAYAVYRLEDESYVGRFRIRAGAVGSAEETDGIDLAFGDFGPAYPGGLFVAQDGMNAPAAQNFKLVAWADIAAALGIPD
ncbi:MAG TPA: phytase [Allosphingosinicella sp.]|jgi:3-phytase